MDELELEDALEDAFNDFASGGDEEGLQGQIEYLAFLAEEVCGLSADEFWEMAGTAAFNCNVHTSAGRALGLT